MSMHLSGHFKKFSRSCVLWGDLAPVLSVYTADSISGIVPRVLLAVYFDTFVPSFTKVKLSPKVTVREHRLSSTPVVLYWDQFNCSLTPVVSY